MSNPEPFVVAVTVTNESGQVVMQFQYDWNDRDLARNAVIDPPAAGRRVEVDVPVDLQIAERAAVWRQRCERLLGAIAEDPPQRLTGHEEGGARATRPQAVRARLGEERREPFPPANLPRVEHVGVDRPPQRLGVEIVVGVDVVHPRRPAGNNNRLHHQPSIKEMAAEQMSQCAAMRAQRISPLPRCLMVHRNGVFGHTRHNP